MGEHIDKDVSGSTVLESSKETVSDRVASGDSAETRVFEAVASDAQFQGQGVSKGSSAEGVVTEKGGSCNGADTVAGVMGSGIYVDGVCTRNSGGENLSEEATKSHGQSRELVSEGDVKAVGGGGGDSNSKVDKDANEEASNLGTESEVEKSSVFADSKGELVEDGARVWEEKLGLEIEVGNSSGVAESKEEGELVENAASVREVDLRSESETEVGTSSELAESKEEGEMVEGDTRVRGVNLATGCEIKCSGVAESKEEGVLVEGVARVREITGADGCCVADGITLHEIDAGNPQNVGIKSAVEDSSLLEGSSVGETQNVVEKEAVGTGKESLEGGLGKECVEKVEMHVVKDMISQEVRDSENEASNRGVENCGDPSAGLGSSVVEAQDIAAEKSELVEEVMDQAKETHDNEGAVLQNSEPEKVGALDVEEWNPGIRTAGAPSSTIKECSSLKTHCIEEEAAVMADIGNLDPKVETVLEGTHGTDSVEGVVSSSEKDLVSIEKDAITNPTSKCLDGQTQLAIDGKISSMNNEEIACPNIEDLQSSQQPTQVVVGGEVVETENEEVKVKESIDESESCDSDQGNPNIGQLMAVQEPVTHFEQHQKEEKKVVEQNTEAEPVCASRETDTILINGEKTAITDNDVTLNPGTGLEGPPEGDQIQTVEEDLDESAGQDVSEIESSVATETVVEEHDAYLYQVGLQERQEMEAEGQDTDFEKPNATEDKSSKQAAPNSGSTVMKQACYQLPPDDEGELTVSDLVWGKVRSHPWWPGQIFDPSDASEKAMKYHKKDCFLVAYFGDRTFAWNDASLLKPFRAYFSQVEKQSNSEAFQNAVDCALEEVSRRVEFGLACSCIPKDTYDEIKFQIVENTGIREEASVRDGADKSLPADLFEPGKLVEYMKALAQCPAGGADRLELVIARSQLLAFYHLKGYSQLPEFQVCGGLLENVGTLEFADEVIEHTYPVYKDDEQISSNQKFSHAQSSYGKRKHNLKDTVYPRKKERSLSELMGDSWDCVDDEFGTDGKANNKLVSPSSGKKRKVFDSFPDDSATAEGRKTLSLAKVSTTAPPFPKPSFKIGECIRRVASQMTGSTSILKSNNTKQDGSSEGLIGDGSDALFQHSEDAKMSRTIDPTEYSSLDELLSQLHLAAQDPFKGYSLLTIIISFFSDFRNSVIMEHREKLGGERRQASHSIGGSSETFEFEDMSDTYWTDRVIQNGSEEQPSRKSRKRDNQLGLVNQDKALNKSNSRKRYSDGNCGLSAEKPVGYIDENAPAELVMHFPVVDCVPSEIRLNKMFRRFGPLKEPETEVDKDTNRARVVFKRCADAEAAYGSASKFNIFGSILVNYQLNYTISVPFKSQPMITFHGEEDATLFLQY